MKEIKKDLNRYIRSISRDTAHYFPLLLMLTIGGILLIFFSYNVSYQAVTAGIVAFLYVIWGVVHHFLHKDLDAVVIIEYVLVASLGLLIIYSMLFNT